jgi:type VI protein secretion system component Hcp
MRVIRFHIISFLLIISGASNATVKYFSASGSSLKTKLNSPPEDSITCLAFGNPYITNNTVFNILTIIQGVSNNGTGPSAADIVITKNLDSNSINLAKTAFARSLTSFFEIKFFHSGSTTPYYSLKVKNVSLSYQQIQVAGSSTILEKINFKYTNIGFKNWSTGTLFGWDLQTMTPSSY